MSDSLLLSTRTQFIMSQISSTLDKDAKRRKCTYRHRLPVMHVCIYQYTYCTPGTYYVLTAVVFLAQLQREIASKTNADLLLLYSYLKKKRRGQFAWDQLHLQNWCSSHVKRKAIFIRKKITCMYYLYNQLHIQVLICLYIN